jgi:hypothetical protein
MIEVNSQYEVSVKPKNPAPPAPIYGDCAGSEPVCDTAFVVRTVSDGV